MNISVIIPTTGRRHGLPRVLEALLAQPLARGDEIVVVDDASPFDVRNEIGPFLEDPRVATMRHEWSKGLSAARNTGIRRAHNEVVLLWDDNLLPSAGLLDAHRAARARRPGRETAVFGAIEVHQEAGSAPFSRYAERVGWREFASSRLPREQGDVDCSFLVASNVSFDKSFLTDAGGFDELFAGPDCEARDLGVRLAQRGMRLIHAPAALAGHREPVSIRTACKTEYAAGRAFYYFALKHPDAGARADVPHTAPDGLQPDGAGCAALLRRIEGLEAAGSGEAETFYPSALALHFVRGLEDSRRENEGSQRLCWSGGEWVALRPSNVGSLVRIQSTKGAERENEAILAGIRPDPEVLFVGLGNGSQITRHLSTQAERRCFLFEPHEYLYRLFRSRHDPRRVTRIGSIEEMLVYWPHRPMQACILPALKASAAWPYAAVSGMLGARQHFAELGLARPLMRAMVVGPIAGPASAISLRVKEAFESLGIDTRFLDNSVHLAPLAAVPADGTAAASKRLNDLWLAAEEANITAVLHERPDLVFVFPRAPLSVRALTMLKASGIHSAFWLSEDYRSCPEWEGVFRHVDWFFTSQEGPFLQQLRDQHANAHFLPLAESSQEYRDRVLQALALIGSPRQ